MKKTLTKADIVEAVVNKTQLSRSRCMELVEDLLASMRVALKQDGYVLLSGFGKFECYAKAERRGRNPKTEEQIVLAPRKVVVFRLSRKFKTDLNPRSKKRSDPVVEP